MTVGADRLVHMANQIARNLAIRGDGPAARATSDHIVTFWDPRMKDTLLAMDRAGLEPVAAHAVALLAGEHTAAAGGGEGSADR